MRIPAAHPSPPALVASGVNDTNLRLNIDQTGIGGLVQMELISRAATDGLNFSRMYGKDTWEDGKFALDAMLSAPVNGRLVMFHGCDSDFTAGIEGDGWFAAFTADFGWWMLRVAGKDRDQVDRLVAFVETLAGEADALPDDHITMAVWSEHPMGGGMARYGAMKVGPWTDVYENYPPDVRAALESLTTLPEKGAGGLVVFGGVAGTGKTRAIEALCHAWARDAKLGVVVDADRLFDSAAYMADVLTTYGDNRQVIVVEDCDDMIVAGPKQSRTAKVLNIADGLVGRLTGGGTLLVLTANLPLDEIGSYVTRPGRAAAAVEFRPFTADEAAAWLASKGMEDHEVPEDGMTLAEMYAAAS